MAALTNFRARPANRMKVMGRRTDDRYKFEVSLPNASLVELQGPEWPSLQVGARVQDSDAIDEPTVEVLWRTGSNRRDNRPLAHFIRK